MPLIFGCTEEVLYDFEENLSREKTLINEFLNKNNIEVQTDKNGFLYKVLNEGVNEPLKEGDTVYYNYQMYLLDSTLIDSNIPSVLDANNSEGYNRVPVMQRIYKYSIKDEPYFFLDFALTQAKEQSALQIFVPSYLAYGSNGYVNVEKRIAPNSPILFQFEVVEISR